MLNFTDKKIGTVEVPITITENDIEAIMVASLEGGSSFWMGINNSTEEWADKPKGEPLSTWATHLILEGKVVKIYDIDKDDEDIEDSANEEDLVDRGVWELTLDKLLNGIKLNHIQRPSRTDKEDWDAYDCDCIVQYAIFGEIVFS